MDYVTICSQRYIFQQNARYTLLRQWIWICGNIPQHKRILATLISFGNTMIQPGYGELASGLTGEGRMAEPEAILEFLSDELKKKLPLKGKKALVTAGPTYEAIDPVRFIGNHSSGKMGFAIAEELAALGASVVLVSRTNIAQNLAFKELRESTLALLQKCLKQP
jgi:phosphopantothenoylcysteine decarboxylase/phosphopantothenate--cysteine ligase